MQLKLINLYYVTTHQEVKGQRKIFIIVSFQANK